MAGYNLSWITENLAVGHAPMSYEELDHIRSQGIDAIVNLCGAINCVDYWAQGRGVNELGLGEMNLEQIQTFLNNGL